MWLQSLLASALIGRYELNTLLGHPRKKGIVIIYPFRLQDWTQYATNTSDRAVLLTPVKAVKKNFEIIIEYFLW